MLLVTAEEARHISRPLVDFGLRQPVGVGDVTSGLLLVKLLQGQVCAMRWNTSPPRCTRLCSPQKYAGIRTTGSSGAGSHRRTGALLQRHPAVTPGPARRSAGQVQALF